MLQEAAEYNGIDLYDPNLVERLVQTLSDLYHEKLSILPSRVQLLCIRLRAEHGGRTTCPIKAHSST